MLVGGAEYTVQGAVAIANKLKIQPIIIGLTIVALGTSTPEFVVSLKAALSGNGGISLGNIVGSNIANIFMILGVASLIYPIKCRRRIFLRDYKFLFMVSITFVIFALSGEFVRWHGIVFIFMLFAFIYYNYKNSVKSAPLEESTSPIAKKNWPFVITVTLVGLGIIVWGAELLIQGSVNIALRFGISQEIIGLTIIAVGTSLPELATTVMAAIRHQNAVALGNVIGSNIWNIVFIMGFTATVTDVSVPVQFIYYDIWILLLSTILILPVMMTKARLSWGEGLVFVSIYTFYLVSQVMISLGYWSIR